MQRIIWNEGGSVSICCPAKGTDVVAEAKKVVPKGVVYKIVDTATIPTDRTFRDAWQHDGNGNVVTDIPKAKLIAHDKRRQARAEAFKPLDVQATVPALAKAAEAKRQVIRDNDAKKQIAIDAATTETELKAALGSIA